MGYAWKWLSNKLNASGVFGNVAILAFMLMQFLDGIFTYVGLNRVISNEGNPLVSWLMLVWGIGLTTIILKTLSVLGGLFLYCIGYHKILAAVTVFICFVAVLPWAYLFLTH